MKSNRALFIIGFVAPFIFVGIMSVHLNAFGVFGSKEFKTSDRTRMINAFSILHKKPRGLVMGASTASMIDPNHPGWNSDAKPVVQANTNFAMFYENLRTFQHAQATTQVKQVVVDLLFVTHLIEKKGQHDFSESRLRTDENGKLISLPMYFIKIFPDVHAALFSEKSLRHIVNLFLDLTGFQSYALNTKESLDPYVRTKHFNRSFFPPTGYCKSFSSNREEIRQRIAMFVEIARENQTDLRMFIEPFHARKMEKNQTGECWEPYKLWIRDMVDVLAEDRRNHPEEKPFQLWNFSGYNSITKEPITPLNEEYVSDMHWYRDAIHYRKPTGLLILDRIFDYDHPDRKVPDDFGVLLTEENVEDHLKGFEQGMQEYQKTRAADFIDGETFYSLMKKVSRD